MRRLLAALGVVLIIAVLAGCEAAAPSGSPGTSAASGPPASEGPVATATTDGEITMMLAAFGNEIWVPRDSDGVGGLGTLVQSYLIDSDGEGNLTPGVAESWTISEDGKTWSFKIRQGIKFHDGTDLTAEDVAFSLNTLFGPDGLNSINGSTVAVAEVTESITVEGGDTVVVVHATPLPFFGFLVSALSTGDEGVVIPQAYYEEVGPDGYNAAPVGAGPYKVTDLQPGSSVTLERFDDFYVAERMPSIKTINVKQVPELATRAIALTTGEADMIQADLPVIDQIEAGGGKLAIAPEASYVWVMLPGCWNVDLPCNDIRVRQALDLAVDKTTIMSALYGELWEGKGWQYVTPHSLGYSDELAPAPYDPDQAAQLLADAGYPEGEGFPLLIVNATNSDPVSSIPDLALLFGQAWSDHLGIETEIRVGDASTMRDRWRGRELDGQIFMRSNEGRYDGGDITRSLYGNPDSRTRQAEDPAYWAAVEAAEAVVDPEQRGAAYNALYLELRKGNYEIPTGLLGLAWGLGPRVADWQPWGLIQKPSAIWTLTLK